MEKLARCLTALCTSYVLLGATANITHSETVPTQQVVTEAKAVIESISTDNVQAAKRADTIFTAANRLLDDGKPAEAKYFFETGLQLSPWDMQQQLNFAKVLSALGEDQRAVSVAKLVYETAENSTLLLESAQIGEIVPPSAVLLLPDTAFEKPVIAFVRLGDVDDWIIQQAGNRLSETLGSPVYLSSVIVELPAPHRSYFKRWSEQLKKDVVWDHPFVRAQMTDVGVTMPELATLDQTLEILARIEVAQGKEDPRPTFSELKQNAMARDQQWDASKLDSLLKQQVPRRENVVLVGITRVDIYAGDSNYVFGTADIGSHYALVSTQRFEAQFNSERENQPRFLDRMHKQLLSSVGFAFGIPRPTDPRSARSYPNSLADHDLKGTWLSRSCIEEFEKVLGHSLPKTTLAASQVQ